MTAVLLVSGLCLLLGGIVAVGFGVPYKEFSLGSTLILTGVIAACTGMTMLGFWSAVRELKRIALELRTGTPGEVRAGSLTSVGDAAESQTEPGGTLFGRDQPNSMVRSAGPAPASQRALRRDEASARDRERGDEQAREQADAPPEAKPRRNLLFSSTSRRERERAQARLTEPSPSEPASEASASSPASRGAAEANVSAGEDDWQDRTRAGNSVPPRHRGRAPSSSVSEPSGRASETKSRTEDQSPVTVLKSGVVDGMAYSLYSDGSIEAQMPEGMMRFASIDELRAHLDQRP